MTMSDNVKRTGEAVPISDLIVDDVEAAERARLTQGIRP